jgi:hypothetical protein
MYTGGSDMDVYRYELCDPEVTIKGYILAKDEDDALAKARKACYVDKYDEDDVGVEFIMNRGHLENLLINGECETFYDDWD